MSKAIKAGVLAGIVLFIWSAISWMLLPWHTATFTSFKEDKPVAEAILNNVSHSGMYMLPANMGMDQTKADQIKKPFVFASVRAEGMEESMTMPMLISLLTQIIAATLVASLLFKTRNLTYFQRVSFVVTFALAAGIVVEIPYWNWFGFDPAYTLVSLADLLVGWFLAGLVLAKFHRHVRDY